MVFCFLDHNLLAICYSNTAQPSQRYKETLCLEFEFGKVQNIRNNLKYKYKVQLRFYSYFSIFNNKQDRYSLDIKLSKACFMMSLLTTFQDL